MLSYFTDLKNHELIILDANFILIPSQFGIDYFEEIRNKIPGKLAYIVFKSTLDELNKKKEREYKKIKFQQQLELSLQILKSKRIYRIPLERKPGETVDNFLISVCQELLNNNFKVHLATNDSKLRSQATSLGINVIYLRQKKKIIADRFD
jgi:rRNA-processing protein FCF1